MKRFKRYALLAGLAALGLLIADRYPGSTSLELQKHSAYESEAVEGTKDNPGARLEYEQSMLRDPATGRIPAGIAHSELAFAHRIAAKTDQQSITANEDWVSRGPHNIGGRTRALAIDATDENVILAGGVSSGMFKSIDGGNSWTKTTAPNQIHSVTSIAQNEAAGKTNIWYYSTGDRDPESLVNSGIGQYGTNSFYRGDGIFKSTDGGSTWTQLASTVSGTPDQTDPFDFVFGLVTFGEDGVLAATGWGIYRSTDGGESWRRTLGSDPTLLKNPNSEIAIAGDGTIYASIAGDGPDRGLHRSDDGETWEDISPDDWAPSTVRTVIAPAPSAEKVVYFFTEVVPLQQRLRKYEDGVGWTDLTSGLPFNAQIATYGGVLMVLGVKPDDENTLFLGAINFFRSTNGGQSFDLISGYGANFHVDMTSIAFYPSDPGRMIVGNDGGLYRVADNLSPTVEDNLDWESLNNGYLTTQFYTVAIDHGTPGSNTIIGGTQDNGFIYGSSADPTADWQILLGGDGSYTAITDGGTYAYMAHAASLRLTRATAPFSDRKYSEITPTSGQLGTFLTVLQLDPHDQRIMYVPLRRKLWRNSNLTAIPEGSQGPTDINWDSFENFSDVYFTALGMSGAEPRRLYVSGFLPDQSSKLFYLDNPHEGQPTPVEITGENFPFYPFTPRVVCIAVDPRDANNVIVVFPSYGVLSLYATQDGGQNWTPVSGNLEENPDGTGSGPSVRWLSILYLEDSPIYLAGTSVGLFSSPKLDGMDTKWSPEATTSIGNVIVDMIDVRQSDGFVAVGTHGNGVYSTYITKLTTANEDDSVLPEAFELTSAYPNPFNTSTTVQYELPKQGHLSANVFDIRGRKIETLFDGMQQPGIQSLQWTPAHAANGVYFIRLEFGNTTRVEKVLLQR